MKEDLLGRQEFITMLEMLISNKVEKLEGCSLAIDGKWGCGKSFIIRELEKKLRARGFLVVHYNCWQYDYYEEPLEAILSVLVDSLNSIQTAETIQDKKKKKTKEIAIKLFKEISFMIAKNKLGVDFKKIGIDINELRENVGSALDKDHEALFNNDFDKNSSLKKCISAIYLYLLKIKLEWKGVVLIVDEIDRCLPEYAIKVLERLHHVCYDTDNDSFQFVQLIAMNREELCDGISKAYGRALISPVFNEKTAHELAYSEKEKRFKKGSVSFGNYYLQKFIQLIIPVPVAKSRDSELSILKGFENKFQDSSPEEKKLIEDFFCIALKEVPMRIKEETIEFAQMVHDFTVGMDEVEKPSLNVLCVEIIDCLCRFLLKSDKQEFEPKGAKLKMSGEGSFVFLTLSFWEGYVKNPKFFLRDFHMFFKNEYEIANPRPYCSINNPDGVNCLIKNKNSSYIILWYYLDPELDVGIKEIDKPSYSDIAFVKSFRKTLNMLLPLNE